MNRPRSATIATLAMVAIFAGLAASWAASSTAAATRSSLTVGRAWPFALPGLATTPSHFCSGPNGTCVVGDPATAIPWGKGTPSLIVDRADQVFLWFRSTDSPTSIYQLGWDGRIVRVISDGYSEPELFKGVDHTITSVASDPERGFIYFVTGGNNAIIRVNLDGTQRRVIGLPTRADGDLGCGKYGDGGDARQASVLGINSIDVDKTGRLLIADGQHYRIRAVGLDGIIQTLAGVGVNYFPHQECPTAPCHQSGKRARRIWFDFPGTVVADPDGSFWFSEINMGNRGLPYGKNHPYGFQPLWHVDLQGIAHAVWTRPFATFTLDPRTGNPIVWDLPAKQGTNGKPGEPTQRIIEINRNGKRVRQVIRPPRRDCDANFLSLTCGDGHRPHSRAFQPCSRRRAKRSASTRTAGSSSRTPARLATSPRRASPAGSSALP